MAPSGPWLLVQRAAAAVVAWVTPPCMWQDPRGLPVAAMEAQALYATAKGQAMSPTLQTDPPHALLDPAPDQKAATGLRSPIWGHAPAYSHAVAVIEDAKSAASGLPSVPVWPTAATGGIVLHNQVRKPSLQRSFSGFQIVCNC